MNGPADGVYNDCDGTIPIRCDGTTCIAKRNGRMKSVNENVTRQQLELYVAGKNITMLKAAELVGPNGSFYNKNARATAAPVFGGGNLQMIGGGRATGDPRALISEVATAQQFYKYLIVGGANSFSNPEQESLPAGQNLSDGRSLHMCSVNTVAQFLLAVEPGVFLLCNGWDARFDRKLGLPTGKAVLNNSMQVWKRSFASGVTATWDLKAKKGAVEWPGHPPTPPGPPPTPPRPHPHGPPPPPWSGPQCPGPKCPIVPAQNYKGCYHDKHHGCDLPCTPPGASGSCTKWTPGDSSCLNASAASTTIDAGSWPGALDSKERCNQLCLSTGVAFK